MNDRQCFHCNTKEESLYQKLSINYGVFHEKHGFNDIRFYLSNPNNEIIVDVIQYNHHQLVIPITIVGEYRYCFDNSAMNVSQMPKRILFKVAISEHRIFSNETLERSVFLLNEQIKMIDYEVDVFNHFYRWHYELNENTNRLLIFWSLFESLVSFSLTIGQIWYLKKFFEVRKII